MIAAVFMKLVHYLLTTYKATITIYSDLVMIGRKLLTNKYVFHGHEGHLVTSLYNFDSCVI